MPDHQSPKTDAYPMRGVSYRALSTRHSFWPPSRRSSRAITLAGTIGRRSPSWANFALHVCDSVDIHPSRAGHVVDGWG